MEISEVLQKIGLSDKEAYVYMALLELGTASVDSIAKKAGTKRPTTYLVLDDLQKRGMVSVVPREKKALFSAESPESFLRAIHKQEELLKRFMPEMMALHNEKKEKPKVQLFEGNSGVVEVYKKIYESSDVRLFGNLGEVTTIDKDSLYEFARTTTEKKIVVKDLIADNPAGVEFKRYAESLGEIYKVKLVPANYKVLSDMAVFQDKVVFFSFHPYVFAVLTTSKDLAETFRSLHDMAWNSLS
ncbi:MAG TPA: helix-turn-helix domain-containing protein [Patescibacteria group bacterium]|nr:helix-turn-helix domain-containing protein [Patescibacteria group bacterium]